MSELKNIPNVGKRTEQDLLAMGYTTIASLKGKSAQELYDEECALRGTLLDRCQLYLYRAVEYFVNTPSPDPAKLRWWFWKDDFVQPSPCGAVCAECALFPASCAGCARIEGKVHWLQYTGEPVCAVYDCCVNIKKLKHCGNCPRSPLREIYERPHDLRRGERRASQSDGGAPQSKQTMTAFRHMEAGRPFAFLCPFLHINAAP